MKRSKNKVWMFYQNGNGSKEIIRGDRVRLVYPSGKVEWSTLDNCDHGTLDAYIFKTEPCWYDDYFDLPKSRKEALMRINVFDKSMGFKKQVFIGAI